VTRLRLAAILSLLLLVASAALADSIASVTPSSFFLNDVEEFITLGGVNLFGTITTQVVVSGPAGSFTRDTSGGWHDPTSGTDTLFLAIPDAVLRVAGHYSVTVVATDDTAVRTIGPTYFDVIARSVQQPPLLAMPEAVFAEATGPGGANVTFTVSGISFVDPAPSISCDHASGALFPLDSTTVHRTATDSYASTSGSFEVFVTDTVAPVVSVPADIASSSSVVNFTATATDAIDGSIAVTCTPASGSTFPTGLTTVFLLRLRRAFQSRLGLVPCHGHASELHSQPKRLPVERRLGRHGHLHVGRPVFTDRNAHHPLGKQRRGRADAGESATLSRHVYGRLERNERRRRPGP
jgi:hypothetical protein